MVREDILEGLKLAALKGEPLRKAMMSFYNAGYTKKDIEEAARALQALPVQQRTPQQSTSQPVTTPVQIQQPQDQPQAIPPPQPVPQVQPPLMASQFPIIQPALTQIPIQFVDPRLQPPTNVIQRVSEYGQKPSLMNLVITFMLVFFLLFLLGVLTAVFLFKEELSNIFSGFLSLYFTTINFI